MRHPGMNWNQDAYNVINALLTAEVLLYIRRNRRLIEDVHLDFHTAPELRCPAHCYDRIYSATM